MLLDFWPGSSPSYLKIKRLFQTYISKAPAVHSYPKEIKSGSTALRTFHSLGPHSSMMPCSEYSETFPIAFESAKNESRESEYSFLHP